MVTRTRSLREESLLEAVGRELFEIKWSTACVKAGSVKIYPSTKVSYSFRLVVLYFQL